MKRYEWPKTFPPLTPEQQHISDDFMQAWLQNVQKNYGLIENFNHSYAAKRAVIPPGCRTLEIGAGIGTHLHYENLDIQEYHCVDLRPNVLADLGKAFPKVRVVQGDCQLGLDFPDGFFNRIIAINILEHLPDLPRAVAEIGRLLAADGTVDVIIPCDPGFLYGLGRKISAERMFRKRYKQDYHWFISREHINDPGEIMSLLRNTFDIALMRYFPCFVPVKNLNLFIGFQLRKKQRPH